jgi:histidyl-tRNA synthetase
VKPSLLRGFDQEYLPQEQLQFNALIDLIRRNFELFGFLPIETPSAERREVLTSKGGVEKEIYALTRLAEADDDEASTKGAMRFDLTVPLARYVAMRERELAFPFRRYQIQRVWRGETPQANKGRFREFYQCDIDIIGREKLSYLAEAEIPAVIYRVFREMQIGEFLIRINNRKALRGMLQKHGVSDQVAPEVLRVLDKLEKIGPNEVAHGLSPLITTDGARDLLHFLSDVREAKDPIGEMKALGGGPNELYDQGLQELEAVTKAISDFGVPDSACRLDLGVVRGLDYYTGTIYETSLVGHPELGSICSGGRYDDLASYFTDTKLPGVGISIGLTRLFSKLREINLLRQPPRTPAEVLVTTMDPQSFGEYLEMARILRDAGINTEVYLEPAKLKKQFEYAERKGFRVALIAGSNEFAGGVVKIKDLAARSESDAPRAQLVESVNKILHQPRSS